MLHISRLQELTCEQLAVTNIEASVYLMIVARTVG